MQKMEDGRLAFLNGSFSDAVESYTDVLQTQVLSEPIRVNAIRGQLDALLELGQAERARELLQRYLEKTDRPDRRERKAAILHVYAKYLELSGEPKAAVKVLREELSYLSSQYERYYMRLTENYLQQARLFLDMCELSEARIYLDLASYCMNTDGDDLLKACYYHVEARYLLASRAKEEALQYLFSARELFLLSGARWWAEKTDESLAQITE